MSQILILNTLLLLVFEPFYLSLELMILDYIYENAQWLPETR